MSNFAVLLSAGMFVFSAWMFVQTSDWVALVFMVMSVGYGALFLARRRSGPDGSGDSG